MNQTQEFPARVRRSAVTRWLRKLALVALFVFGAAAVTIVWIGWRGIPFPAPTGSFAVGRTSYHLSDLARPEVFTSDDSDHRELMVTVHYPAADEIGDAARAKYLDDDDAAGFATAFGLPRFLFQAGRPHALERPPCRTTDGGFPLLIFSPGFGQPPVFYTAMLEDLASHGFVVASVSHPYNNGITVFPGGRFVLQNEAGSHPEDSFELPTSSQEQDRGAASDVGAVWVGDLRFVLDELIRLNSEDELLRGRINVKQVGVFGHSFGGAAALRVTQVDDRFVAAINMDGTDLAVTTTAPLERPVLWLNGPSKEPTDEQLAAIGKTQEWFQQYQQTAVDRHQKLIATAREGARFVIRGFEHQSFSSDLVLGGATWPWSWLIDEAEVGTIPGIRPVVLVNSVVRSFFAQRLLGEPARWKQLCAEFPELEINNNPKSQLTGKN